MTFMESRINLDQALDILNRLEAAAPGNTAAKLAQIIALLKELADENTRKARYPMSYFQFLGEISKYFETIAIA